MSLRKAIGQLDRTPVRVGAAEDHTHQEKPYFIPDSRVAQAKQMVAEGREKGIEFVVPVDSIIEDGSAKDVLEPGDQQFDIGPLSSQLFSEKVSEFIARGAEGSVVFHNG